MGIWVSTTRYLIELKGDTHEDCVAGAFRSQGIKNAEYSNAWNLWCVNVRYANVQTEASLSSLCP